MDKYLIKYLRDNAKESLIKKYIDFFKIELDWHIYNGETNIAANYHRDYKNETLKGKVYKMLQLYNALFSKDMLDNTKQNVLSTVHFPQNNNLTSLGFNSISPVWQPIGTRNIFGDLKTIKWDLKVREAIRHNDFNSFLNLEFVQKMESFQKHLIDEYKKKDFGALLLNTDQYFHSKYFIDIFKKLGKPSIVFSHGLPGIYSLDVDNRSDYLMVWGEKIRQNYINAGFDPAKIKVTGSPKYRDIAKQRELKSNFDDILVIPTSIVWHQNEYDNTIVIDKSSVILYLYKVQNVLKSLGIKKSRYRVHPSINKAWIHTFLDKDFYAQDNESLQDSLHHTSLVIGSTSTLLLDALIEGINYIVFEPTDENNNIMLGSKAVPPFDGSETKVMLCKTEEELKSMLLNNAHTEYSLVHDYIQEFNLEVLKDIIY